MSWYFYVPVTIIGICLLILFLVYVAIHRVFHRRYDGKRHLKYLTANDFPGLLNEPVEFPGNRGQPLRGFLYYRGNRELAKGLVVFCHGIGAGHYAYTTEINAFAKQGYLVLAYDYTGCVLSGGNSIKGMTQALIDLDFALAYVERHPELARLKRILFGHSWGGYVVNNVFSLKHTVDRVVSVSGFNSVPDAITDIGHNLSFFKPWFHVINFLEFGRYATYTSVKSLKKSTIPTFLIHSRCDPMVRYKRSLSRYIVATKGMGNFTYDIDEEKMHNPYLTIRAEQYLNKIMAKLSYIEKKAGDDEQREFYASLDYDLLTEEDPAFMKKIFDWIEERD
jgi:uncharacterized protein